ncbi:MAG: patatin-like phospholipase family protein [Patescibacteria group bacterium]|nr:patatin-like phospholipase family protein [Patescibacteria group bacterium]
MCIFRKKKKVGLALGSGGPRGLAHIGVIKVLLENNIPIDYIAGSSVGAIVGGLYSYFGDIEKLEKYFAKLTYKDMLEIFSDPRFAHGVFKGEKALKFLRKTVGNKRIEKLKIPFTAIATDLKNGEVVELNKGDLAMSIRASASIPVFFRPIKIGRRYLVDGGNAVPVPVETVRKMGADIIIAVDLDNCYVSPKNYMQDVEKASMTQIAERALDILSYSLAKENIKNADIVINPDVYDVGWRRFVNGGDIIRKGEEAAKLVLEEIKRAIK